MNERIKELFQEAIDYADKTHTYTPEEGFNIQAWDKIRFEKFAELIVKECAGVIHLESKDFANGNCFADDELWKSVTTEYGKNRERGFDPIGMSIHFEKILKKHFGVEE